MTTNGISVDLLRELVKRFPTEANFIDVMAQCLDKLLDDKKITRQAAREQARVILNDVLSLCGAPGSLYFVRVGSRCQPKNAAAAQNAPQYRVDEDDDTAWIPWLVGAGSRDHFEWCFDNYELDAMIGDVNENVLPSGWYVDNYIEPDAFVGAYPVHAVPLLIHYGVAKDSTTPVSGWARLPMDQYIQHLSRKRTPDSEGEASPAKRIALS